MSGVNQVSEDPGTTFACLIPGPFDYGLTDSGGALSDNFQCYYDGLQVQTYAGIGNNSMALAALRPAIAGGFTTGFTYENAPGIYAVLGGNGYFVPLTPWTDGFVTLFWGRSPYVQGGLSGSAVNTDYNSIVSAVPVSGAGPDIRGGLYSNFVFKGAYNSPLLSNLVETYDNYFNWWRSVLGNRQGLFFGANAPYTTRFYDPGEVSYAGLLCPWEVTIEDNDALNAEMQNSSFQNSINFFGFTSYLDHFPNQAWTPVLLDCVHGFYYLVEFIPHTPNMQALITGTGSLGTLVNPQWHLSRDGVIYVRNNKSNVNVFNNVIGHTYQLNLDYQPLMVNNPPPLVFPCFNPCGSVFLGR